MAVSKFRIRFRKAGDLRFLSHHDLMRAFERMLRRAALPFKSTEGFHPKPKMAFASALALGIIGRQEVIEIEFDGELPAEDVTQRLAAQAPPGLEILSVRPIDPKVTAQVSRVTYRIALDRDRTAEIKPLLAEMLGGQHCWVERTKPQPRRVDIQPFFLGFELSPLDFEMTFKVTPNGTARPDEVLRILQQDDLLADGAVLERTSLELDDELPSAATNESEIEVNVIEFVGGGGDNEEKLASPSDSETVDV